MARKQDIHDDVLNEVTGKPVVTMFAGTLSPSSWGRTTLELTSTRVVERTKFLVTERHSEILLSQIQAVEYISTGNPLFLALGIPLIAAFGLGIILLVLYFLLKQRFLVVRASGYHQAVTIKGDIGRYLDFMQDVLDEVDRLRRSSSVRASLPAEPAPAPRIEAHPEVRERVAASPTESRPATTTIRCPECSAEYRLPAGTAAKKFRCQKCQTIIEV